VVLDEMTYPLIYGWVSLAEVVEVLKNRPREVHVVITGRDCPAEVVEIADTVSEVRKVKHAYEAGIPAQRGIED
jgi:cob(I)alamin adenosyltransferase